MLTRQSSILRGAGRTDAGVHAIGQVAIFDTESRLSESRIVSGLNNYLGTEIAIMAAYEAPLTFDPRRDAVSRVYRYRLLENYRRSPLRRRFTHLVRPGLDINKMKSAALMMIGTKDFRAFSGRLPAGKTFVRNMLRVDIWRIDDEIAIEFEGNAFLPQQVRRMVAVLVDVGYSKITIEKIEQMFLRGIRGEAQKVFPSKGLILREVKYKRFP